ncbi:hypothetical protein ACTA71_006959 [Dictyostelium dimigraforme]
MAPEFKLQNNKASHKSNIWNLGCTIIEMAGGNIKTKDSNINRPKIPIHLSFYLKNIIQRYLIIEPSTLRFGYLLPSITNLSLYSYNLILQLNSIPLKVVLLTLGNNFTHSELLSNIPNSIINLEFKMNSNMDTENSNKINQFSKELISSIIVNEKQIRL